MSSRKTQSVMLFGAVWENCIASPWFLAVPLPQWCFSPYPFAAQATQRRVLCQSRHPHVEAVHSVVKVCVCKSCRMARQPLVDSCLVWRLLLQSATIPTSCKNILRWGSFAYNAFASFLYWYINRDHLWIIYLHYLYHNRFIWELLLTNNFFDIKVNLRINSSIWLFDLLRNRF